MYNDSNSLGYRVKEGRRNKGRHAGTGEGISAPIYVANSHADRTEDGRRSDRRYSENSLWERVDSCMRVGASILIAYAGGRARPHGATWLPILLVWRFFALRSKDDEGVEKKIVFDLVVQNI